MINIIDQRIFDQRIFGNLIVTLSLNNQFDEGKLKIDQKIEFCYFEYHSLLKRETKDVL